MQFRLNFDDKISAELIAKIHRRANSGSLHKALQIMVIEWNALEDARNQLDIDPIMDGNGSDSQDLDGKIEAAFASIDDAF